MHTLQSSWITEGALDFEYKKYLLLAYLQHCKVQFAESRLYPPLAELVGHYRNLEDLRNDLLSLQQQFPKELSGIDSAKVELTFTPTETEHSAIHTIEDIISFALPNIQQAIDEGRSIYEFVDQHIEITPVGLVPVYHQEGYVLLNVSNTSNVDVYQYKHSVLTTTGEALQSLRFEYLFTETRSLANTVENIKSKLASTFRFLPNPATWLCLSKVNMPTVETLLPVAKRKLLRTLGTV